MNKYSINNLSVLLNKCFRVLFSIFLIYSFLYLDLLLNNFNIHTSSSIYSNKDLSELEENSINIEDIKKNKEYFKYYGGDMRKLFQLAKENYCVRSMKVSLTLNGLHKKLSRDDFQKSIEQITSGKKKEDNTSHLMMYI
jgi:hypothetical protein